MRKFILLNFILVVSFTLTAQVKEKTNNKIALVIGVSNYEYAGQLKNTLNDANDISTKLEILGYKVIKMLDPEIKSMNVKIDSLAKKLKTDDNFLFYFSGHGAEYNGENYLFVKNSNPSIPSDMPYETFPIGKLLGKLEFANVKTSILILDACRNNPFVKSWSKSGIINEGLVNIDAPNGTFIGFAASPGKTASDGARNNGTYTEAIIKFIELKNISIDQLFNKINKEVRTESNGKQIPFKNSSLEDEYYFNKDETFTRNSGNSSIASDDKFIIAPINRPVFPMPKTRKGYRKEILNSFALTSINKTTFDKNEFIELNLSLLGENIWDKATPLYVSIVKRRTPTSVTAVYDEEFQPTGKNINIRMSSSLPTGTYELTFGFYLINELNQEYPTFYSKTLAINIL